MRKDKEARKEYHREYMQKKRQGLTEGFNKKAQGLTVSQDTLDKLTSPFWRDRLEKIRVAFESSHHPAYAHDVFLGDAYLDDVFELMECTR